MKRPVIRPLIVRCTLVVSFLVAGTLPLLAAWPPAVPETLVMTVRENTGVARTDEVVRSGVPLPRALDVRATTGLVVVHEATGLSVPATFRVLARWHAARTDPSAAIQWLLVAFPATVAANDAATYRLVLDGSAGVNPSPAVPLSVNQSAGAVSVDTGVATFVVGGPSTLFDRVARNGGPDLVTGGALDARVDGVDVGHSVSRAVRVEHADALSAVVVVEGQYDLPAVGGGAVGSLRRYEFRAGSPTAIVRHAAQWEGSRCGMDALDCGGTPNALLVERVRDGLDLAVGAEPWTVTAVGRRSAPALVASASLGDTASVVHHLRDDHVDPLRFTASVPGSNTTGSAADGGMVAVAGGAGTVAVALARMHRYEPQALRLEADGDLAIHVADDRAWLGAYQGLFANLAVGAHAPTASRADLERDVWAPLNHPLRAWPDPAWFAASEAVPAFPVGALPADLMGYDTVVEQTLERTRDGVDATGIAGLMTFGVYPRIWGSPLFTDEIDCFDGTPGQRWDNKFWCGTWTDYHNTVTTAPVWAMRTGDVTWLDEIATPAALRMLHTQIVQCAPGDTFFYCGQAPMGYGAYRSDNNGSHAYLRNLTLYHWLTGDETVTATLERGGRTMRGFMCPGRDAEPPGPSCAPDAMPVDDWASINGRTANQWFEVFRLLGLTRDRSFLDDWSANTARWLTLYYAQPDVAGQVLGFMSNFNGGLTSQVVDSPGSFWSDQLWIASLYDFERLARLATDSDNASIGLPAVTPRDAGTAWARTLARVAELSTWSNGGPDAPWPNEVRYTISGARIGGTLDALEEEIDDDGDGTPCEICGDDDGGLCIDLCLYDTGKAPLAPVFLRAADATGDAGLRALGEAFTRYGIARALADPQALNKLTGEYLLPLHEAVARMTTAAPPLFEEGFETGDLSRWGVAVP